MFNSFIKNLISNNKKNKFVIEQNGLENSKLLAKIINKSLVI